MTDLLQNAGPFVWPIVFASIVGLAVFLERLVAFARLPTDDGSFVEHVLQIHRGPDPEQAVRICQSRGGPVAHVLASLLTNQQLPREEREQAVLVVGNRQLRRLERGLRTIAVVARLAPLMGLLGTVVGLVEAFRTVSQEMGAAADPSVLANGIWQALLTTVAGLLVAIPAIVSHEWLQSRVDEMALRMQEAVAHIVTVLHLDPPGELGGDRG